MTVGELIDRLRNFEPNATVMRQTQDLGSAYNVVDLTVYGLDVNHVFLVFDDEEEI
jgi:hypothetical protein